MKDNDAIERLLTRMGSGEHGLRELVPDLYEDLRRMAEGFMRKERADHTLQATALVNEAFLRCGGKQAEKVQTQGEFLALAARIMRNTLVDHARARAASKRQALRSQISLAMVEGDSPDPVDVLDLEDALAELERLDPRQAQILELSAFGGLNGQEIAEQLGVHRNTVVNELRMGRAWLRRALETEG